MKTTSLLTALMLFAIQTIVNGQALTNKNTKSNESTLLTPTKKLNSTYAVKKEHKRNKKADKKQNYPEPSVSAIIGEMNQIDKQIAELQKLRAGLDAEIGKYVTTEVQTMVTPVTNKEVAIESNVINVNSVSLVDSYFELQNETEELSSKYSQLVNLAKTKAMNEKTSLMAEAKNTFALYEIKKIEFSELAAKMSYEKFTENKVTIQGLLINYEGGNIVPQIVNKLSDDAEVSMRMAKEMREEANAQPNKSAKLGTYSNAEEKEALALGKQGEAINMLEKTAHMNFQNISFGLVINNIIINNK